MSSSVKSGNPMIKLVLLIIVSILFVVAISSTFKSCKKDYVEKRKQNKIEETNSKKVTARPSTYTEVHSLKKGQVVRVMVPFGYKYDSFGGGKKYYHQDQNGRKEIWGDGTFHQASENVAYFELSYYDEEITVVCEFKKQ